MTVTDLQGTGGIELGGQASLEVRHGGQVPSDIVIEWDFDNDGDFDGPHEDITGYVMSAETLSGRDYPGTLTGLANAGTLRLTLDNRDDRFNFFNQNSPLNQDGNSLRIGRKIRVRTVESSPSDPVLLARDRFNRPDGPLAFTETGQAWTPRVGSFRVKGRVASVWQPVGTRLLETVDVGTTNHYVQATVRQVRPSILRDAGVVVRYTDNNNWTVVALFTAAGEMRILDRDAGTTFLMGAVNVPIWEGMTIGADIQGQTVTGYVAGVPVITRTLTGPINGTHCGLYGFHQGDGRTPEIGDFHVWDKLASPTEGVLWTGDISDVQSSVAVGPVKTVTVTAEGILARAARAQIASPRMAYSGVPTGVGVGEVMARAGLMHPPVPLDEGTVTTGPVGINDGDALSMARLFEETERGFLYETNEGQVGFQDAESRSTATSVAWFTDTQGRGQFGYSEIEPLDHKGQIINEVTAGVAPAAPSGITVTEQAGTGHVDITLPSDIDDGDLLFIFIASSIVNAEWLHPIFWVHHRDIKDAAGMRIYSRICNGTEDGVVQRFYSNTAATPGLWIANIVHIKHWFGAYNNGIEVGEVTNGPNPGPVLHGWGRDSTLFISVRTGIGGKGGGMSWEPGILDSPDGYVFAIGNRVTSGVPTYEVGIVTGTKIDCTDSEDPTAWGGLVNVALDESVVVAVRGYNGPHTKPTLQDPRVFGGEGVFVTVSDPESQNTHNAILSHRNPSSLFNSEEDAEAYGNALLAKFSDDHPIITLSFPATLSASHRAQAIRRRVGDKITVTATGVTGLGIEDDFFIEAISHRWSRGAKVWETTWHLSPA